MNDVCCVFLRGFIYFVLKTFSQAETPRNANIHETDPPTRVRSLAHILLAARRRRGGQQCPQTGRQPPDLSCCCNAVLHPRVATRSVRLKGRAAAPERDRERVRSHTQRTS